MIDATPIFNGVVQLLQSLLSGLKSIIMSFAPQGWFDLVLLGLAILTAWLLIKWKNFVGTIATLTIGILIYLVVRLA